MKQVLLLFIATATFSIFAQPPAQVQRPVYFACSTAGGLFSSKGQCDLHCKGGDCTPVVTKA